MGILYRYIFRGIGILMLLGMITILLLAVMSQNPHRQAPASSASAVGASR
jgi:hypothetical protein